MKRTVLTFILCCSLINVSFPQFNDSINYYINYTATGLINKINEGNSYTFNNQLKFNLYKKRVSLNTTNSWIYGYQRGVRTNNDFMSAYDVSLFKSQRHIYYWGLVNVEKSYSLKINHRLQTGAGIGYYLIDREHFVLQISDGILYEKTDLYDTGEEDHDYQTLRNSFRIKFRFILNNLLTLEGSDFLQHALDNKKDYIIRSNTNASLKLRKWLSFTVNLQYNKLSITNRENLLCNFGLTMEKYF